MNQLKHGIVVLKGGQWWICLGGQEKFVLCPIMFDHARAMVNVTSDLEVTDLNGQKLSHPETG